MCGILGWLTRGDSPTTAELLRAAELMRHRGPDDRGVYEDPASGVALAHNRLSIIDLTAAGHQPMFNEDRTVALVFNGEIYNFEELRGELVAAGHRFVSRTDSEVLVHGYEQWGKELVRRLCGMFAFAIWDSRRQELFLARDPMGMKPLYFWVGPRGELVFASEVKAFLGFDAFPARPNLAMLRQYLEFNFIYDTRQTSLAGVEKLPAGHMLTIRCDDLPLHAVPASHPFYEPPAVEPVSGGSDAVDHRADRLFHTLERVVAEHLVADVPVGLLLSGGLDSSLIAALAARRQPIRTLCMGFADSSLDERPYARSVAEWIGSQHEEIVIEPGEIAADLERSVWYVDDLFGDWGVISTMLLYGKCRAAGVKVVLVGEGSDELFGGYPNYVSAGGAEADGLSLPRRILRLYRWYSGRRWGGEMWRFGHIVRDLHRQSGGDPFATVRRFETRHQLPHCFNMKVDKASMAVSVEARVPFLDVRVANEGFRAPREMLLREGTNKFLLRHLAARHKLLPPATATRPKLGGSIAANWMDESPSFRAFARDVILDPAGWTRELGLDSPMRDYFDRQRKGYRFPRALSIFSIAAWRLLLLNLWARHYLTTRTGVKPAGARGQPAALARTACCP